MALYVLSLTDENGFVRDRVSRVAHDRFNFAQTACQPSLKRTCVLLHVSLSTGCCLVGVQFVNGLSSRLGTDIPGQNIRGGNGINWHAQDTTVLQPEVFLTGVYRLLITQSNNRVPTAPKVKHVLVSQQE